MRNTRILFLFLKGSIKISQEDPEPGFWLGTASFETKSAPPFQVRQQPKEAGSGQCVALLALCLLLTGTRAVSCPLHPAPGGPDSRRQLLCRIRLLLKPSSLRALSNLGKRNTKASWKACLSGHVFKKKNDAFKREAALSTQDALQSVRIFTISEFCKMLLCSHGTSEHTGFQTH